MGKTEFQATAGAVRVGDSRHGHTVDWVGPEYRVRVTDENACAYGLEPGLDSYPVLRLCRYTVAG